MVKVKTIRDRLKTTYSWSISYVDNRRRDLDLEDCTHERGDGFGKKGKISPCYVVPYGKQVIKFAY